MHLLLSGNSVLDVYGLAPILTYGVLIGAGLGWVAFLYAINVAKMSRDRCAALAERLATVEGVMAGRGLAGPSAPE